MSLMFHIRAMTKDEKKRRLITKRASELADKAMRSVRIPGMGREPFMLERTLATRERDTMLMHRAYNEGRFDDAEEIREKLFKQKQTAQSMMTRGIPGIESATGEQARDKLRRYRRAQAISRGP